jgi:hypothetical protein
MIDPSTIEFAGGEPRKYHNNPNVKIKDINSDHIPDMEVAFKVKYLDLVVGVQTVNLSGETTYGTLFQGDDTVNVLK